MKIIVMIKSIPDTASTIQLSADNQSVLLNDLENIMNPYDSFALEEGVLLKEAVGGEVVAVSMGDDQSAKCLRQALAVGADSAIWVKTATSNRLTSCSAAKVLASIIRDLTPDILFAGKQSLDSDAAQLPERVAELLDIPHVSAISSFSISGQHVTVDHHVEDCCHTVEMTLPALFTTDKGLNVPRYPKLMDILNAKKKALQQIDLENTGVMSCDLEPGMVISSMALQNQKRAAEILVCEPLEQVNYLIPKLKEQGSI